MWFIGKMDMQNLQVKKETPPRHPDPQEGGALREDVELTRPTEVSPPHRDSNHKPSNRTQAGSSASSSCLLMAPPSGRHHHCRVATGISPSGRAPWRSEVVYEASPLATTLSSPSCCSFSTRFMLKMLFRLFPASFRCSKLEPKARPARPSQQQCRSEAKEGESQHRELGASAKSGEAAADSALLQAEMPRSASRVASPRGESRGGLQLGCCWGRSRGGGLSLALGPQEDTTVL